MFTKVGDMEVRELDDKEAALLERILKINERIVTGILQPTIITHSQKVVEEC